MLSLFNNAKSSYLIIRGVAAFQLFIFLSLFAFPAAAQSPWELNSGETRLEGLLLNTDERKVQINTSAGKLLLPLDPQVVCAIMGSQYGTLVTPLNFPLNIYVELFLSPQGTVRAMRNIKTTVNLPQGPILKGWGHNAFFSPDEEHYLIYNYASGLSLYSMTDNNPPIFLTFSPVAAWSSNGNCIAYLSERALIIYNVQTKTKTALFNLPDSLQKTECFATDIVWNEKNDKLLLVFLQDYPNVGSDLFQLAVCDAKGKLLAKKTVPNLGQAIWLDHDAVLYTSYSSIEQSTGQGILWDFQSSHAVQFLPERTGGYNNLAYCNRNKTLAYTTTNGLIEEMYLFNTELNTSSKTLSQPFPIRNLQWSNNNTLFYWDEINNIIYEINEIQKKQPMPRANGYLPVAGVRNSFIYFLSVPIEEPQQPFLGH